MSNQTPPAVSAENPVISTLSRLFDPLAGSPLWEVKAYKSLIKESQQWMDQYFRENRSDNILQLVEGRSWLIDQILTQLWNQIEWPVPVSLIAVGGYGRGELHPYSDIDLLILSNAEIDQNLQGSISRFIQFLWDIGLEVGHSVRSSKQCIELAQTDITVCTNLIESRVLIGDAQLMATVLTSVHSKNSWTGSAFFNAKVEEQDRRHEKYNDTEYDLEPNVKSSPGALRDIHIIAWIARY